MSRFRDLVSNEWGTSTSVDTIFSSRLSRKVRNPDLRGPPSTGHSVALKKLRASRWAFQKTVDLGLRQGPPELHPGYSSTHRGHSWHPCPVVGVTESHHEGFGPLRVRRPPGDPLRRAVPLAWGPLGPPGPLAPADSQGLPELPERGRSTTAVHFPCGQGAVLPAWGLPASPVGCPVRPAVPC